MTKFKVEINPAALLHSSLVEELQKIAATATSLDDVAAKIRRCTAPEQWLITHGGHHVALNSRHVTYNTTHRVAMIAEVNPATSYAPEVIADSSGQWCGNALRFATREEAEANVVDLARRWTAVREARVVESNDPVNYAWVNGKLVEVRS